MDVVSLNLSIFLLPSRRQDVISDLIRAGNDPRDPRNVDVERLFCRAIDLIEDLRRATQTPPCENRDIVTFLKDTAGTIRDRSEDEIRDALLTTAEVLRTLKIVGDTQATLPPSIPLNRHQNPGD